MVVLLENYGRYTVIFSICVNFLPPKVSHNETLKQHMVCIGYRDN